MTLLTGERLAARENLTALHDVQRGSTPVARGPDWPARFLGCLTPASGISKSADLARTAATAMVVRDQWERIVGATAALAILATRAEKRSAG